MTDEQRTADPTLTAYLREQGGGVDVAVVNPYEDGAVAHRISGETSVACGAIDWSPAYTFPAFVARWVCRPCKRCFPPAT